MSLNRSVPLQSQKSSYEMFLQHFCWDVLHFNKEDITKLASTRNLHNWLHEKTEVQTFLQHGGDAFVTKQNIIVTVFVQQIDPKFVLHPLIGSKLSVQHHIQISIKNRIQKNKLAKELASMNVENVALSIKIQIFLL